MSRLVMENQGLVNAVAKKYAAIAPIEDLKQEGNLGLLRAIELFDPAKGNWGTYAYGWIHAVIRRYVKKHPTVHGDLSGRVGFHVIPVVSLDAPRFDDGDATLLDTLVNPAASADDEFARHQLRQQVRDVLKRVQFSDFGAAIIHQRLMRDPPAKLHELATQFSVSKERVRQVELRVRAKLERFLAPIHAGAAHV